MGEKNNSSAAGAAPFDKGQTAPPALPDGLVGPEPIRLEGRTVVLVYRNRDVARAAWKSLTSPPGAKGAGVAGPPALEERHPLARAASEMMAMLEAVSDELDDRSDVVDGPEGQPRPNWAMSLKAEVDETIASAKALGLKQQEG